MIKIQSFLDTLSIEVDRIDDIERLERGRF